MKTFKILLSVFIIFIIFEISLAKRGRGSYNPFKKANNKRPIKIPKFNKPPKNQNRPNRNPVKIPKKTNKKPKVYGCARPTNSACTGYKPEKLFYSIGESISYYCNGQTFAAKCKKSGSWSHPKQMFVRIDPAKKGCVRPNLSTSYVIAGSHTKLMWKVGETVSISCSTGLEWVTSRGFGANKKKNMKPKSKRVKCNKNGEWDQIPICGRNNAIILH